MLYQHLWKALHSSAPLCRVHWPDALSQHSWMRKVPVLVPALSSVSTEPTEQCKVKSPHFLSKIPNHGVTESKHSGGTQIPCFIFSIHLLRLKSGERQPHTCTAEGGHWTPVASHRPNDPTTDDVRGGRAPPSPAALPSGVPSTEVLSRCSSEVSATPVPCREANVCPWSCCGGPLRSSLELLRGLMPSCQERDHSMLLPSAAALC